MPCRYQRKAACPKIVTFRGAVTWYRVVSVGTSADLFAASLAAGPTGVVTATYYEVAQFWGLCPEGAPGATRVFVELA